MAESTNTGKQIIVRKANKEDMDDVMKMIQELADFEKCSHSPQYTTADLIKEGGFENDNDVPLIYTFIAEEIINAETSDPEGRKKAGYAISFYTFSSWEGRGMLLEDIYVRPDYRKLNIGKALFSEVCKFAVTKNCKRLDFHVLDWNPAQAFYKKLGAINMTETEGRQYFRVDHKTMSELASTRP